MDIIHPRPVTHLNKYSLLLSTIECYLAMDMDAMDEEYEMPKVLSEEEYSSYRKVTKEETRMRDEANISKFFTLARSFKHAPHVSH